MVDPMIATNVCWSGILTLVTQERGSQGSWTGSGKGPQASVHFWTGHEPLLVLRAVADQHRRKSAMLDEADCSRGQTHFELVAEEANSVEGNGQAASARLKHR